MCAKYPCTLSLSRPGISLVLRYSLSVRYLVSRNPPYVPTVSPTVGFVDDLLKRQLIKDLSGNEVYYKACSLLAI